MNGRYWFIGDQLCLILNWMLNNNRLLHGKLSQITICEDWGWWTRHTGDASISPFWLRWSLAQERSCIGFCEVQVNKLLSRKLSRAVSWINMDLDGWTDGWIAWGIEQHTWEGEENFQTFVYTWRHFFYHLKLLWNKKPYLHRHFLLFVSKRYVIIIIINVVLPPSILVFSVRISDERVDSYTQTMVLICVARCLQVIPHRHVPLPTQKTRRKFNNSLWGLSGIFLCKTHM